MLLSQLPHAGSTPTLVSCVLVMHVRGELFYLRLHALFVFVFVFSVTQEAELYTGLYIM